MATNRAVTQVFERRTGVDLAGAKESDKKKKALSKLRNACAQVRLLSCVR